ncbi:MAG: hypothetical protein MK085_01140 [Phycisphaerales bacterium]|nr:hypothetical protein [Phycisphaerales bacterium]
MPTLRVHVPMAALVMILGLAATASAQMRVCSWNIARLYGDETAIEDALAAIRDDDKPGFAVAPAIMVFQEVRSGDREALEALVAAAMPDVDYTRGTYTSSSSEDGAGGAQLLLYRSDFFTEDALEHEDIFTQAGRRTDRWKLRLLGSTDDAGVIWVYSSHLKASGGSSNEALRLEGAEAIRDDAATLPANSNIIFAGDFNVYSNSEDAYQEMISAGVNRGTDPLGSSSWSGAKNAIKHTQSPLASQVGELIGGGMDDRFDIIFLSEPLDNGEGFTFMSGTYRAFGNDGNHYNESINDGNNSYYPSDVPRSNDIADALYEASDHIPVLCDFVMPGALSCILSGDLGRVVSGGTASVNLRVTNARPHVDPSGIDELQFVSSGDSVLLGGGKSVAPLLPDFEVQSFALAPGLEGDFQATVEVQATSVGVSVPYYQLVTSGTAVRAAVPSFSSKEEITEVTVSATTPGDAGVVVIEVPVHNFGWSALQAALDIESAIGFGGRFFPISGFGDGVTDEAAVLQFGFLSDDADDGRYMESGLILTSDEDIPGETTHQLVLTLEVEVGAAGDPADINGDGLVNGADLGLLLSSWGPCPPPCPADINGDGAVNGADLGLLLASWKQ